MGTTWNVRLRTIIEESFKKGMKVKDISIKYSIPSTAIYAFIHRHGMSTLEYKNMLLKNSMREQKKRSKPGRFEDIKCSNCIDGHMCHKCWYYKMYEGFKLR